MRGTSGTEMVRVIRNPGTEDEESFETEASGFRSITTSVDALLGPGAKSGEFGRILESDFDTLDDGLDVVNGESFQEVGTAAEALGPTIFVFELGNI